MWWHRAETRFRPSSKRTSQFKSVGGRQFSRLLAAEVCATAVVMLDTPCSEVVWRVLATKSIRQFPSSLPLQCFTVCHHILTGLYLINFTPQLITCKKRWGTGSIAKRFLTLYTESGFPNRQKTYSCTGCWYVLSQTRNKISSEACQGPARFQQHRDASCHQDFFFPARQGAEGNSGHTDRNSSLFPSRLG